MPFWRIPFKEEDDASRDHAMGLFDKVNKTLDAFSEQGLDPQPKAVEAYLGRQGTPVTIHRDAGEAIVVQHSNCPMCGTSECRHNS